MSVTALRPSVDPVEWSARVDLAAAFRLAAMYDWHEAVANHFSLAIGTGGRQFLMNPRWMHFSRVRASDLLLLDAEDPSTMDRPDAPDPSAWCIHGRIHALLPEARCVLHLHPPHGTALACLADPTLPPIDQNSARYFRRISIDTGYSGIADRLEEGERLAGMLGTNRRLMMGNHGVLVVAPSVAEAFDDLYYLERSARTVMTAYSTGRALSVLSDEVAEATALAWEQDTKQGKVHFTEMCRLLDRRGEDYAT